MPTKKYKLEMSNWDKFARSIATLLWTVTMWHTILHRNLENGTMRNEENKNTPHQKRGKIQLNYEWETSTFPANETMHDFQRMNLTLKHFIEKWNEQ